MRESTKTQTLLEVRLHVVIGSRLAVSARPGVDQVEHSAAIHGSNPDRRQALARLGVSIRGIARLNFREKYPVVSV